MSEFAWWLLVVGLIGGGGLVWLVTTAGTSRPSAWLRDRSEPDGLEVSWIEHELGEKGRSVSTADVTAVLELHRSWTAGAASDDDADAWPEDEQIGEASRTVRSAGYEARQTEPPTPRPPESGPEQRDLS